MYQIFTGKRDKNRKKKTIFFVNKRNERTQSPVLLLSDIENQAHQHRKDSTNRNDRTNTDIQFRLEDGGQQI